MEVAVLRLGPRHGTGGAGREVARRLASRPGVRRVTCREVSRVAGSYLDPFDLGHRVADLKADAAVVVVPTRWGPRRIVPGPVVAGRPVALVQADGPQDLPPEPPVRTVGERPWVVAAMAKDVFLEPTAHWAETLESAGRRTVDLRADRARRDDLVGALRHGPGVVLYAGHGRTRGWSGYQGLRWRHLRPGSPGTGRPAGVVVAFACDTLKRSRSRVAFGTRLVAAGVARAYVGAVGSIRTADAEALSEVFLRHLARQASLSTVTDLLASVEGSLDENNVPARRAWTSFRLLGDPTAVLA